MIFSVVLSRFILVLDSMYRNRASKIVVSSQILMTSLPFDKKDRHLNLSKLSKMFVVQRNPEKQIWYKFMSSDSENKDTHCIFLRWLQNSNHFYLHLQS